MLNTTDKIIKHKTGLLNLAEELGNVSKACQVMGYSRDTFYRYKSAVDEGGVEALFDVKVLWIIWVDRGIVQQNPHILVIYNDLPRVLNGVYCFFNLI